jgi:hypothetical protein
MNRRDAVLALLALGGAPIAVAAQQVRVYRVASSQPSWARNLRPFQVYSIPNTKMGSDYRPTIKHPLQGVHRNIINAESGFALKRQGSIAIFAWTGGHADGTYNQIVTLQLESETPTFVEYEPGSALADVPVDRTRALTSPSCAPDVAVAYFPDGRPAGCHNYDRVHFIDSENRLVRMQASVVWHKSGHTKQDCVSFDWATKQYAPPGTIPNCPWRGAQLHSAATCKDPITEDIYAWFARTIWKWTRSTNEWSAFKTGAPNHDKQYPIATDGSVLVSVFCDDAGTIHVLDLTTKNVTTYIATGPAASGVSYLGVAANHRARSRLFWVPPLNKYFYMRAGRSGNTDKIYTLQWTGSAWNAEQLVLTGDPIPEVDTLGPTARLHYIPNLNGVLYAHSGRRNMMFFKVA